jgi:hypothetical protein
VISVCVHVCVCARVFTAIEYRYAARVVLVVEVPQVCAQYHAIFRLIEQCPERKREGEGKTRNKWHGPMAKPSQSFPTQIPIGQRQTQKC